MQLKNTNNLYSNIRIKVTKNLKKSNNLRKLTKKF